MQCRINLPRSETIKAVGPPSSAIDAYRSCRIAQKFLAGLDEDPAIGRLLDHTGDYEHESNQMLQKTGEDLSPEMWVMKLLLGPIDTSYDSKGEPRARGKY